MPGDDQEVGVVRFAEGSSVEVAAGTDAPLPPVCELVPDTAIREGQDASSLSSRSSAGHRSNREASLAGLEALAGATAGSGR